MSLWPHHTRIACLDAVGRQMIRPLSGFSLARAQRVPSHRELVSLPDTTLSHTTHTCPQSHVSPCQLACADNTKHTSICHHNCASYQRSCHHGEKVRFWPDRSSP